MSMNIPCEMTLRTVGDRMVLCANPIAELRDLYQEIHQTDSRPLPCRETLREAGYDLQIELSGRRGRHRGHPCFRPALASGLE